MADNFRSAFDMRNRLLSLVQGHPLMSRHDPPLPGEFPRDILPYDPGTISPAEDVQVVLTTPGQNFDPFSVGGAAVGKLTILASITVLIYVANAPRSETTPEEWLMQKMEREVYLGQLTTSLLQAVFSYPVDPTPGDQYWNVMKLAPTAAGLHTAYFASDVFHLSRTRIHLSGQMSRPPKPSGRPSAP